MAVDLTGLEARIRRLQKLHELLADEETRELITNPEVMEFLRQVTPNGNGASPAPVAADEEGLPAEGTLRRKVLTFARNCPSGKFNARYIMEKLDAIGHKWEAADHMIAVNTALRSLEEKKFVRVAEEGSGRRPNLYEAAKEAHK